MSEKEGSSSDNGSGGDKQAVEKGGGERQEAPFSASQQAWLMELFEKAGSANQRQAPKLSEVDERTDVRNFLERKGFLDEDEGWPEGDEG